MQDVKKNPALPTFSRNSVQQFRKWSKLSNYQHKDQQVYLTRLTMATYGYF